MTEYNSGVAKTMSLQQKYTLFKFGFWTANRRPECIISGVSVMQSDRLQEPTPEGIQERFLKLHFTSDQYHLRVSSQVVTADARPLSPDTGDSGALFPEYQSPVTIAKLESQVRWDIVGSSSTEEIDKQHERPN